MHMRHRTIALLLAAVLLGTMPFAALADEAQKANGNTEHSVVTDTQEMVSGAKPVTVPPKETLVIDTKPVEIVVPQTSADPVQADKEEATASPEAETTAPEDGAAAQLPEDGTEASPAAEEPTVYHVQFFTGGEEAWWEVLVAEGMMIGAPNPAPTREGSQFLYWHTANDSETAFEFTQPVTADMQLYAAFETKGSETAGSNPPEENEAEEPTEYTEPTAWVEYTVEGNDTITLTAHVEDEAPGAHISYQWQNNANGDFENVPEATGRTFTFTSNDYSLDYQWRLRLSVSFGE